MGFLQYFLKKVDKHITTEQTQEEFPWKSLQLAYTPDGSLAELFVANRKASKIKDFRTGKTMELSGPSHPYTTNYETALAKLYNVDEQDIRYKTLSSAIMKYTKDAKIPGKAFSELRTRIRLFSFQLLRGDMIRDYDNFLVSFKDVEPVLPVIQSNIQREHQKDLNRTAHNSEMQQSLEF